MRTRALALLLCGLLSQVPGQALAQGVDLHIIAPSAPGTGWDQVAQILRTTLAEKGGLSAAVTNVPGSGGMVGLAQFLASGSETDLLVTGLTMLDSTLLSRSGPGFERLTPIARISSDHFAVVVPANSPMKSIGDLTGALSADPGRLTWAGGPTGGVDHVAVILLAQTLDIPAPRLNYVPFLTSAEAALATAEEKVGVAMLAISEVQAELASGRLRSLGVSAPERLPGIDVPTLKEAGLPLVFANWRGIAGKPDLSRDQQARLTALVSAALKSPAWQEAVESRRWQSAYLPPEAFQLFVRDEQRRVKEALKAAGLYKRIGE